MAKYKKHADGLCKTTISTGKYDENGKLITISLSASSSAKLEKKVGEVRTRLKLGIYANDGRKTFGEYAMHWFHTYPEKLTDPATSSKYKTTINKHLDGIRDTRLSDITKSDVQELINAAAGHPDTQRMIKLTVNQIMESAIEDGLLYHNVCRKIHVKQEQNPDARRALTDREKNAISALKVEKAFTDMEQLYIDTLYVSGIRPEEALALTPFDIHNSQIHVNKALSWRGGKHIKEPKTKSGYRRIDVPEWYQNEVDSYCRTYNCSCLFYDTMNNYLAQSSYRRFWNQIYNKINSKLGGTPKVMKHNKVITAGIAATDLSPYIFRHNYATMLYYLHVDLKDAARIMGHANVRVMLEIYTHLDSLKSSTQEKISNIAL